MNTDWKGRGYIDFLLLVGGDISPKNIWLTEVMVDIFTENRSV